MLHEHHCAARLGPRRLDLHPESGDLRLVEPRRRLVEEQQARRVDDRPRELDHPRYPDRQRPRELLAHRHQTAPLEHLLHPCPSVALAPAASRRVDEVGEEAPTAAPPLERGQDVVLDREPPERLHPLEGAAQPAPGPCRGRHPGEVTTREHDAPVVRRAHTGHHVEQRRLAGTIRADDAQHLARVGVERHAVERGDATEAHRDAVEPQLGLGDRGRDPAVGWSCTSGDPQVGRGQQLRVRRVARTGPDDPAELHEHDRVGEAHHLVRLLGHEQDRAPAVA